MNTNTVTHDPIVASKVSDLLFKEKNTGGLGWIILILALVVSDILFWPSNEVTKHVYESWMGSNGEVTACKVEMSFTLSTKTETPVLKKNSVKIDDNTVQANSGLKNSYSFTNYKDASYIRTIYLDRDDTKESAVFVKGFDTMGIFDAEGNLLLIAMTDMKTEIPVYAKVLP